VNHKYVKHEYVTKRAGIMILPVIGRRNLLRAGAAGALAVCAPSIVHSAGVSGLATAQRWVSTLAGPGINIERARVISLTYNNVALYRSAAFCAWLKSQGTGYVRNFFGWSPSLDVIGLRRNPRQSDLQPYFAMIELLTSAGIPVRFDFTDVIQVGDFTRKGSVVPAWLATCARTAATCGFTRPDLICFGAFNEPVDDGRRGAAWNPVLVEAFKILRRYLPASTWTLSMQHNYWNDPGHLNEGVLAPDQNAIYDCHYYPSNQPTKNGIAAVQREWAGVASGMAAWSAAHGNVPLLLGEAGLWNANDQPYGGGGLPPAAEWSAAIGAMTQGAGAYRPAPWATTDRGDGNSPPINLCSGASTAMWSGEVTAAYRAASAFIMKQKYYV
jgi:Cellulase (glycosyl hydrolase family 5)